MDLSAGLRLPRTPQLLSSPLTLTPHPYPSRLSPMISIFLAFLFKFFLPLLVLVAVIDVLSQTRQQRIQRLSRSGQSQRAIAERLGITRYQVRLALA